MNVRMVVAGDDHTVERNPIGEADEGLFYSIETSIVIEMFGTDIGDHGDSRNQVQKRTVGFVGFGNEQVTGTHRSARAKSVELAADDDRGIEPCASEHCRY